METFHWRCQTAKFATRNCRRLEETRRGCTITCAWWGVSTRSCRGGRATATTACRAANTPHSTYRTKAANGMHRYTRIPLPVVMQLWWNLISGFWPDYHIRYPDLGKIRY